ncbi:4Fe-4S dicluster domain-containing protein [Paludibacter sp. 221]|uniref:4Fe-4S dicluster domain-containing protein n=1 Tax=Paludibacter sp. 221 TaxID=2302939 RepID=UPI0013D4C237|nr:4Fe-4S dicluster domain-containing protein [Paludibacter sp. 221]NDV46911.1 4Fe-4S dicluster domain-containing protein [Paludibacter sp. 221]
MNKFGYKISKPRIIDLDKADFSLYKKLTRHVPSLKRCMMCGGCTATCSVNNHTEFNFRKCHLMFKHGQLENLPRELDKCMLCGKCMLVCPRGVNTRAVVQNMRILLGSTSYERRVSHAVGK